MHPNGAGAARQDDGRAPQCTQAACVDSPGPRYLFRTHACNRCYDSSPIYTYFPTLLTYDAPPESPYSSGPPTGPLEPMDRLMPNPYPN